MGFIATVKRIGLRIWDSNNRSLGTLFGCIGGFAVGLIEVLSHGANLPILGSPDSIIYKIIAVCLATGIGGNLSSYIGASIDILTNERTICDLIEYGLVHFGCINKREPQDPAAPSAAHAEKHKHFPFITSTIPKEGVVEERRSVEIERTRALRALSNDMIKPVIDKLTEIQSYLGNLVSRSNSIRINSSSQRSAILSIIESIEYTPETIIKKLDEICEMLQLLEHNQTQQLETIRFLEEENRKLKETLRETQAKNKQLAESIMQRRDSDRVVDNSQPEVIRPTN